MILKTAIYRPYDVKECAPRTVLSAGEGFGQIAVDQHRGRFISGLRVFPQPFNHNVPHLSERNPVPGADVCESREVQPAVRSSISPRGEVHTGSHPGDVPSAHSSFEAATLRCAVFQKHISGIAIRRRRAADYREYQSKFFHGIDYTRFPRSAQAGAV